MHASLLLSQLKRRHIANQNWLKLVILHFPFPSMGNERSCCLTHFGKDYEMAFHFPNPAPGHPCAVEAVSVRQGQSRGRLGGGERRNFKRRTADAAPLFVPGLKGSSCHLGYTGTWWLRGCDDLQGKKWGLTDCLGS